MCNAPVEVTQNYISYRNRLIDANSIVNFKTKGKRLMINSYRQNNGYPTMLIMFTDKESAQNAFEKLKQIFYSSAQYKITQSTVMEPILPPAPPVPPTLAEPSKPTENGMSLGFILTSLFTIAFVFSLTRL